MTKRHVSILAIAFVLGGFSLAISIAPGSASSLALSSQHLTAYRTCTVTATPSTTTSVIDATVEQATPTSNFGSATTLEVDSARNDNARTYLKFDLSGCHPTIPSSAAVKTATLNIYASALPNACRTFDVFRVTAAWAEATVTWNNQPSDPTVNKPPASSRTTSFKIGAKNNCDNSSTGYVSDIDVLDDVADYVSGAATNYGWMIRDNSENAGTARTATFSAKNLGTLSQAPQLIVTYVTSP
ncbi:MAG TPA: DNRLRE domain-containing protein [Candidatus Limnocylindrales bacterium]|jgi:hypothetical protein